MCLTRRGNNKINKRGVVIRTNAREVSNYRYIKSIPSKTSKVERKRDDKHRIEWQTT